MINQISVDEEGEFLATAADDGKVTNNYSVDHYAPVLTCLYSTVLVSFVMGFLFTH